MSAANPAHGRVTPQTVGIVHIIVSGETTKDGLRELPDLTVPPVLAGATVGKNIASHLGKFDGVIKLPIGKQTGF